MVSAQNCMSMLVNPIQTSLLSCAAKELTFALIVFRLAAIVAGAGMEGWLALAEHVFRLMLMTAIMKKMRTSERIPWIMMTTEIVGCVLY